MLLLVLLLVLAFRLDFLESIKTNINDVDALHEFYIGTGGLSPGHWNYTSMEACIHKFYFELYGPPCVGNVWNFTKNAAGNYTHDPCPIVPRVPGLLTGFMGVGCQCDAVTCRVEVLLPMCGNLAGRLPTAALGSLSRLKVLSVFNNQLSGALEPELAKLLDIEILNLSSNTFTGHLPLYLGTLSRLDYLAIPHNSFSGALPAGAFSTMNLSYFSAHSNNFSGPIPSTLSSCSNLKLVDLHSNAFSKTVPEGIGSLQSLVTLGLDGNLLTGTLPHSLTKLSSLVGLFLFDNNFETGELPFVDPSVQVRLSTVDISNNQFSGSVPEELLRLPGIQNLAVSGNCFSGSISSEICHAKNLSTLQLNGLVAGPTCRKYYWEGSSLRRWLDGYTIKHFMQGPLPSCLFQLPNLESLHASGNGFDFELPSEISSSLTSLLLSRNMISGSLSTDIAMRAQQGLVNLDLSFNRINGGLGVFDGIPVNPSLILNLEVNRLSGDIPLSLSSLANINILEGNMLDCSTSKANIPQNDPYGDSYSCGSDAIDTSLIILGSAGVIATLVWIVYGNRYDSLVRKLYAEFRLWVLVAKGKRDVSHEVPTEGILRYYFYLREVRQLTVVLSAACFLAGVCYLCLKGRGNRTVTQLYTWVLTSAYLSGTLPAALLLALGMCLIASTLYLTSLNSKSARAFATHNFEVLKTREAQDEGVGLFRVAIRLFLMSFRLLLIFALNFGVIGGGNYWYLQVLLYQSKAYQSVFKVFFSISKLIWTMQVTPQLILSQSLYFGVEEQYHEAFVNYLFGSKIQLMLIFQIMSSLVFPIFVACVSEPSCFKGVFIAEPDIISDFRYKAFEGNGLPPVIIHVPTREPVPYVYNNTCSNSILQAYVPLYQQMYMLLLLRALYHIFYLSRKAWHAEKGVLDSSWNRFSVGELANVYDLEYEKILSIVMLQLMPMRYLLMNSRQRRAYFRSETIFPTRKPDWITSSIPHNLTSLLLLLTFGFYAPPLAIVIISSVVLDTYVVQMILGRFMITELGVLHECHRTQALQFDSPYRPELLFISPARLLGMQHDIEDVREPWGALAVLKLVEEQHCKHMPQAVLALGRGIFIFVPSILLACLLYDILNVDEAASYVIWAPVAILGFAVALDVFSRVLQCCNERWHSKSRSLSSKSVDGVGLGLTSMLCSPLHPNPDDA